MLKNMTLEGFLDAYGTHDPRMHKIKYDAIKQTFACTLENCEWMQKDYEKEGKHFTSLDLVFNGVENFNVCQIYSINPKQPLESIDEDILGIILDGKNTVSIGTDEYDYTAKKRGETVIKFVAKSVDVTEITNSEDRKRILGLK